MPEDEVKEELEYSIEPRFLPSYDYDPNTGEYLTEGVAEWEDSINDYNVAPHSTLIAPPTDLEEFEVACFNVETEQWEIKPDYRRKNVGDHYEGGKAYYDPEQYWWATEKWMTTIGDKPEGMSWDKMERPAVCQQIVDLEDQYETLKQELEATDYYARRLYEFENGYASDPVKEAFYKSELQRLAMERPKLNEWEAEANELKELVKAQYGEEALNHLRG